MKPFRFIHNDQEFRVSEPIKIPGSPEAIDQLYPKNSEANSATLSEFRAKNTNDFELDQCVKEPEYIGNILDEIDDQNSLENPPSVPIEIDPGNEDNQSLEA